MVTKLIELVSLLESLKSNPEVKKTSTYFALQNSGFVNYSGEPNVDGLAFLDEYHNLAKKYDKDDLLLAIKNRPGWKNSLFAYGVKVKHNANEKTYIKPKQERETKPNIATPDVPSEIKDSIENFARGIVKEKLATDWSIGKDCEVSFYTNLPFRRTTTEINELKDFAKSQGVNFSSDKLSQGVYNLGNVKVVSPNIGTKNKRMPSKKEENLRITIVPGSSAENATSKELILSLLKNFKPYKPI